MSGTDFPHGVSVYGAPVMPSSLVTAGDVWFVDPTNGSDDNSGRNIDDAFATLGKAHTEATANQNDIVYYIAGSSSISLSSQLAWTKDYTHLIGVCAPVGVANRARIFQDADATGLSPLINITATGCIFKNLYIFQGVDDNTSLINVQVTGGRNYFENVHFAGMGHNTIADEADARALKLNGAEECLFRNCFIGLDTIARSAANSELELAGQATRNRFEDCMFYSYADSADHTFVLASDANDLDRYIIFERCLFLNQPTNVITSAANLTSAFNFGATINGVAVVKDCAFVGCDDLAATGSAARVYALGSSSNDAGGDYSGTVGLAVNPS